MRSYKVSFFVRNFAIIKRAEENLFIEYSVILATLTASNCKNAREYRIPRGGRVLIGIPFK